MLFRLGTNAYKAGRVDEAEQLLSEAWDLRKSYDIAATLGQVEFERGKFVEANELLDFCLANFPPIESDEKLTRMKAFREQARGKVTELAIDTDCAAGTLELEDGRTREVPLTEPLYVVPGSQHLVLHCDAKDTRATLVVPATPRHTVKFEISRLPALTLVPDHARADAAPRDALVEPAAMPRWPVYVGGGLLAVQVAAAVGFTVVANNARDLAEGYRSTLGTASDACVAPKDAATSLTCSKLSDARSEEHQYTTLTRLALGTAAVCALATVTYWIWADPFGTPVSARASTKTSRHSFGKSVAWSPWIWGGQGERSLGLSVNHAF